VSPIPTGEKHDVLNLYIAIPVLDTAMPLNIQNWRSSAKTNINRLKVLTAGPTDPELCIHAITKLLDPFSIPCLN